MAHKLPRIYIDSKLFPRGRLKDGIKKTTIPDEQNEDIHPDEEDGVESVMSGDEDKVTKAGAAQESMSRTTTPRGEQARREYKESFTREPRGIGSAGTPDLPDRGRDWRADVPGVMDVPEDSEVDIGKTPEEEARLYKEKNDEAIKAFAAAPIFRTGPVVPPREMSFLIENGYSREDVMAGRYAFTPRLRAEYNRRVTSAVKKSLENLTPWRSR
jgi:hypothetical protein